MDNRSQTELHYDDGGRLLKYIHTSEVYPWHDRHQEYTYTYDEEGCLVLYMDSTLTIHDGYVVDTEYYKVEHTRIDDCLLTEVKHIEYNYKMQKDAIRFRFISDFTFDSQCRLTRYVS